MPYVITQRCVGNKDTACYEMCPVDAIHPGPDDPDFDDCDQLHINPVECIDCGACASYCPHDAIFQEADVPEELSASIQINSDFFRSGSSR